MGTTAAERSPCGRIGARALALSVVAHLGAVSLIVQWRADAVPVHEQPVVLIEWEEPASEPATSADPTPSQISDKVEPPEPISVPVKARQPARKAVAPPRSPEPIPKETPLASSLTTSTGGGAASASTAATTPSVSSALGTANGDITMAVREIDHPPPPYPPSARRLHQQGEVLLRVEIGPDGLPKAVTIRRSSNYPVLDEAAAMAIRTWRFVPALRDGQPVTVEAEIPVVFRLEGG